ncbi:2-hydroxyacid dehydrogenase [Celerinatantimonas diazotrophica]|uniref:D-lactate dehydrogenase n=1 Tax=Celerinatantimonas diazotrophica TaxID=412034 RepID=A0A4V2PNE6_9GAMM|nr:2-hydroxyacid dehydrogenase [Celerinatantimonas diazotrophica]TCK46711.1 D-lactate dehydrogenase [Celerinatantimonas diazotrophica]CAG9295413.1 D-lactate dehydrogenase [Celerinatantimonas diazotrophica]
MKICLFSSKKYDREYFDSANHSYGFEIEYFSIGLAPNTAALAKGADAVCAFVNDDLCKETLEALHELGIKVLLMRCAGFNNVDLTCAKRLGFHVARVPAYSPEAVAEHAIALLMTLNRRIHKAYLRTRDANFNLEGLTGFNMHGRTVGVVGTGKIGLATARIFRGFGCQLLGFDPYPNKEFEKIGGRYVELEELLSSSKVISLHCPLTADSTYLIDRQAFSLMQPKTVLINTSRGKLVDSVAAIDALKQGVLGGLALDVYENEQDLFFEDLSDEVIQDDVFRRLSACHNVIFTGHQAFLTFEALDAIAKVTLDNAKILFAGEQTPNEIINGNPDHH